MILVTIIGGSGAGKTSVSKEIIKHFGDKASLLSMDNYYVDLPYGKSPSEFNYDSPKAFDFKLFEKHLQQIKKGQTIDVPIYNMITFSRERGISQKFVPKDLVIVEGLLVLYDPAIRKQFDFSIYIDAPSDERLIRRIERDTVERGRSVNSIIDQYRKFVAPSFKSYIEPQKYLCDIVLPDGVCNVKGMSIIINAVEKMLENSGGR